MGETYGEDTFADAQRDGEELRAAEEENEEALSRSRWRVRWREGSDSERARLEGADFPRWFAFVNKHRRALQGVEAAGEVLADGAERINPPPGPGTSRVMRSEDQSTRKCPKASRAPHMAMTQA